MTVLAVCVDLGELILNQAMDRRCEVQARCYKSILCKNRLDIYRVLALSILDSIKSKLIRWILNNVAHVKVARCVRDNKAVSETFICSDHDRTKDCLAWHWSRISVCDGQLICSDCDIALNFHESRAQLPYSVDLKPQRVRFKRALVLHYP